MFAGPAAGGLQAGPTAGALLTNLAAYIPTDGLAIAQIDQLRGEAGARQVEGAKIGLTHVLGFGTGSAAGVHIFEKA